MAGGPVDDIQLLLPLGKHLRFSAWLSLFEERSIAPILVGPLAEHLGNSYSGEAIYQLGLCLLVVDSSADRCSCEGTRWPGRLTNTHYLS